MNEMTTKSESAIPAVKNEYLPGLLKATFEKLRGGEDAEGIAGLEAALSELEEIVENDQNSLQPQIDLSGLMPAMSTLHAYIKNQDVAGIADLLEDVFSPIAEEWMKGSNGT